MMGAPHGEWGEMGESMGRLVMAALAALAIFAAWFVAAHEPGKALHRNIVAGVSPMDVLLVLGALLLAVGLGLGLRRAAEAQIEARRAEGRST